MHKMRLRKEKGAAFVELIISMMGLSACLLVLIAVGALVVTQTTARTITTLSAQSALVAYERHDFDNRLGLTDTAARQDASRAAALVASSLDKGDYLIGALGTANDLSQTTRNGLHQGAATCSGGVKTPTSSDPVITSGGGVVTATVKVTVPFNFFGYGACLTDISTVSGVDN